MDFYQADPSTQLPGIYLFLRLFGLTSFRHTKFLEVSLDFFFVNKVLEILIGRCFKVNPGYVYVFIITHHNVIKIKKNNVVNRYFVNCNNKLSEKRIFSYIFIFACKRKTIKIIK
jgi:hypothetical protein